MWTYYVSFAAVVVIPQLLMLRSVTVYKLPIRLPAKSALTWPVV